MRIGLSKRHVRGKVSQALVWPNGIMYVFPCAQRLVQLCHIEAAVGQTVEFLGPAGVLLLQFAHSINRLHGISRQSHVHGATRPVLQALQMTPGVVPLPAADSLW